MCYLKLIIRTQVVKTLEKPSLLKNILENLKDTSIRIKDTHCNETQEVKI